MSNGRWGRRDFIRLGAQTGGMLGLGPAADALAMGSDKSDAQPACAASAEPARSFNSTYQGARLNQIAFPMGGIGAGMICLEGTGALSHVSLRNRPELFNEPCVFAALAVKGANPMARVLEGPVPARKIFGPPDTGLGAPGTTYGLPRFHRAAFEARFPFGKVLLSDARLPIDVELTGWSPFEPGDADNSSLPVAALEYRFSSRAAAPLDAVFSFNARNFLARPGHPQAVRPVAGGFTLWNGASPDKAWEQAAFSAAVTQPDVRVNYSWFRGEWFDALTLAWNDVERGACYDSPPPSGGDPSPGASLFVPLRLEPAASRVVVVRLAWYCGQSNLRIGKDPDVPASGVHPATYCPWYAGRFGDVDAVSAYWRDHYEELRRKSSRFSDCFYDTTLPSEVIEAVAANLCILKSPTVLRQTDGRLWLWEGSGDNAGSSYGSCTHVWNYAQGIAHLFPSLERTLRETEFGPSQNDAGHQNFRSLLPIRPGEHDYYAAADGQLGGIMKVYRDWRISGDSGWLRALWPRVKRSLDYCIDTWDPRHRGWLEEPHHNTYDIEFWGPDGMCSSIYLGALQAAVAMSRTMGEAATLYEELLANGRARIESELFNGEYFIQRIQWRGLHAQHPMQVSPGSYSPEAIALFQKEGPSYQYGAGCLADGVLGAWMASVCGVAPPLNAAKVTSHLRSVHNYNLKRDLSGLANPQRPTYALGEEGGLLLCTWPKGGARSLPFVYSNEVWTGIEYQSASHMIEMGLVQQGLEVVRCCRARYDGRVRNPFDEYEAGHWYGRAMSSYALLQAWSGARFDAVDKTLHLRPAVKGDWRCFLFDRLRIRDRGGQERSAVRGSRRRTDPLRAHRVRRRVTRAAHQRRRSCVIVR